MGAQRSCYYSTLPCAWRKIGRTLPFSNLFSNLHVKKLKFSKILARHLSYPTDYAHTRFEKKTFFLKRVASLQTSASPLRTVFADHQKKNWTHSNELFKAPGRVSRGLKGLGHKDVPWFPKKKKFRENIGNTPKTYLPNLFQIWEFSFNISCLYSLFYMLMR